MHLHDDSQSEEAFPPTIEHEHCESHEVELQQPRTSNVMTNDAEIIYDDHGDTEEKEAPDAGTDGSGEPEVRRTRSTPKDVLRKIGAKIKKKKEKDLEQTEFIIV